MAAKIDPRTDEGKQTLANAIKAALKASLKDDSPIKDTKANITKIIKESTGITVNEQRLIRYITAPGNAKTNSKNSMLNDITKQYEKTQQTIVKQSAPTRATQSSSIKQTDSRPDISTDLSEKLKESQQTIVKQSAPTHATQSSSIKQTDSRPDISKEATRLKKAKEALKNAAKEIGLVLKQFGASVSKSKGGYSARAAGKRGASKGRGGGGRS